MAVETFSGEGRYRVSFSQGVAVLVEIWRDGQRMAFGQRSRQGRCARCGTEIPVFLPEDESMEVCDDCDRVIG
jgi:hypothetical protein